MKIGLRTHKGASCRVAICLGLPEHMREGTREIVSVRSTNPRKGHARALMHAICTEADEAGMVLIVQPGAFDEGMSTEQLERWYAGMGFVPLPKDDESAPTVMARPLDRPH